MDYMSYKFIHLIGIFMLFLALGAAAVTDRSHSRWASSVHGVALLLIIVTGFGMLAKLAITGSLPGWVIGKLIAWLALGAALPLARRKKISTAAMLFLFVALGAAAAGLAIWKP